VSRKTVYSKVCLLFGFLTLYNRVTGYPYNLARIYSTKYESKAYQTTGIDVKLRVSYPIFDLCRWFRYRCLTSLTFLLDDAVYPANLECIYPPSSLPEQREREYTTGVDYPYFNLCKLYDYIHRPKYSRLSHQIRLWTNRHL
jgi:hypothetical protein